MQIMIPGLGGRSKYLANSDSNLFWTRLLQTVSRDYRQGELSSARERTRALNNGLGSVPFCLC